MSRAWLPMAGARRKIKNMTREAGFDLHPVKLVSAGEIVRLLSVALLKSSGRSAS